MPVKNKTKVDATDGVYHPSACRELVMALTHALWVYYILLRRYLATRLQAWVVVTLE